MGSAREGEREFKTLNKIGYQTVGKTKECITKWVLPRATVAKDFLQCNTLLSTDSSYI